MPLSFHQPAIHPMPRSPHTIAQDPVYYAFDVDADSAGNVYAVCRESNGNYNCIQEFSPEGVLIRAFGGRRGVGDGQYVYPTHIAVDGNDDIYVPDYGARRIQKVASDGSFILKWGSLGMRDGEFFSPSGVAVDSSGYFYVADADNDRIQKFTLDGVFVTKWGSRGAGNGQFMDPSGIAVDSTGAVYVEDLGNARIQKFTSNGTFLAQWGTYGTGEGQFSYGPCGIAIDLTGEVYVSDGNHRIQRFASNGAFLVQWGSRGDGDGQFNRPVGMAVGSYGTLFVADSNNHRIQKFKLANQPPALDPVTGQTAYVGTPFSLALAGSDPNNDPLAYSASGLPPGLAVDAATGMISGTPTTGGIWLVTASVSDGELSDSKSFTIMVLNTFPGTNVTIDAGAGTMVTFDSVTGEGYTSSVVSTGNIELNLPDPAGTLLIRTVTTTAGFTGNVTISIIYAPISDLDAKNAILVKEVSPGVWQEGINGTHVNPGLDTVSGTFTTLCRIGIALLPVDTTLLVGHYSTRNATFDCILNLDKMPIEQFDLSSVKVNGLAPTSSRFAHGEHVIIATLPTAAFPFGAGGLVKMTVEREVAPGVRQIVRGTDTVTLR